jgi:hypothetical protein
MALVTSAQFSVYLNPEGTTGPPADAAQPVVLTLSDGQSVTVADAKTTALALMEAMRQRKQWMAQLSDDVFVISIGATKLMFCENSLTLQRFVTSFHGVYLHGSTLFSHRNMSQQATLYEALLQSGQLFKTTSAINGNADLGEVNAVLLDWNWPATLLVDTPAIRYSP